MGRLTFDLSGLPKAGPLEGWVRRRASASREPNDAQEETPQLRVQVDWQSPA